MTAIDRRASAPTRPSSHVPHIERILIHSMLTSGEARAQVMPRLRQLPAVARFQTHAIFDALLNLDATGGPVTFGQLEARLPENDRGLLHEVISADEMGESAMGLEPALACLRKLESMQDEAQISELKARIKSCEQQGKMEEALRTSEERLRLATKATNDAIWDIDWKAGTVSCNRPRLLPSCRVVFLRLSSLGPEGNAAVWEASA